MRGKGSRRLESSGAAPDVSVSPFDQFPPDPPTVREAVGRTGDVRRQVEDEGTEADDESEIISVGGPLSIVGACESEGVTFEEAVGRVGLISETENTLDTAGLPICQFSSFSISNNFFIRMSHWPVVQSVKLVIMRA